jgi:uncharacterized protein
MPVDGSPQARPGHPDSVVEDWCVDPDDWGEFLCRGWKHFFSHIDPHIQRIVRSLGAPVVKEARTPPAEPWHPKQ